MRKIPTIFERDFNGDRNRVTSDVHKGCEWVFSGEGITTKKLDGTCCLIRDGKLYKRREIKKGQTIPDDFEPCDDDPETGKKMGWVPVGDSPEDRWHREAFFANSDLPNGTYELLGPKVQGNPEKYEVHYLVKHGLFVLDDVPRDYDGLKFYLYGKDMEGIVFHHPDGRMAKIKLSDFGIKREGEKS